MTNINSESLQQELNRHKLTVAPDRIPVLVEYCQLLWQWNRKINLTRHTDLHTFVTRDMIDTLQLLQHLDGCQTILDVGSGGGVPGILLAILNPELQVSLAESVGKKANVLEAIVKRLKLNVTVHAKRAEVVLKKNTYDALTVRAVGSLRKLLFWFQQQQSSFDRMILIKGPRWIEERAEAESEGLMTNVSCEVLASYPIPGRDHDSVILKITYE